MIKKFSIFCILLFAFSIVFRGFSAQQTGSGSGSMIAPEVIFKSWQIGRSERGTKKDNDEHCSFITSTGTSCWFEASVGYKGGNQSKNISPIDPSTVTWSVYDGNQGIKPSTKLQHNWSGSHPSKLLGNTSFNVVGQLKLDAYSGETTCTASDANRANRSPVHRGGTKLAFKIQFKAQTKAGQTVSDVLSLEAIEEDQIRQEYVDMDKPIPSRDELTDQNTYDFGHYKKMMDVGLQNKHVEWVKEINKLKSNKVAAFSVSDFYLSSGYRNPHHNEYHAGSTAVLSSHMYGYALDVRGTALAGGKKLDIDGDKKNTDADREDMATAAEATGSRKPIIYKKTKHVHADWAPSDWGSRPYSSDKTKYTAGDPPTFSLPPDGTDSVACDKQNENSCDVMVSSSTEHYVTCPNSKCGDSYWSCDSDDYDEHRLRTCTWTKLDGGAPCGKSWRACEYPVEQIKGTNLHTRSQKCATDPNGTRHCSENGVKTAPSNEDNTPDQNVPITPVYHACGVHQTYETGNHSLQASCSETDSHGQYCTETNYYACQYHTHQYPALISGACGHSYTASSSYSHRSESCPTNSNGDSCTAGSYYVCQSHTHQYPEPTVDCAHPDCNEKVNDRKEHRDTCGSGNHYYWSGCPSIGSTWWHSHSTHQYKSCSRCSTNYRPCDTSARQRHSSPKRCAKEKWRRVNGKWKKVKCAKIFYSCQNGNSTCNTGDVWCQDKNGRL